MKKSQAAGRLPAPVQASSAASAGVEASKTSTAGWDPYEVWRTRVLLAPAAEPGAKTRAIDADIKPLQRQSA